MRWAPGAEERLLAAVAEAGPEASNGDLERLTGYAASTLRVYLPALARIGGIEVTGRGSRRRIELAAETGTPDAPAPPSCGLARRPARLSRDQPARLRPAMRLCLRCRKEFLSSWCGERMCVSRKRGSVPDA